MIVAILGQHGPNARLLGNQRRAANGILQQAKAYALSLILVNRIDFFSAGPKAKPYAN